MKSVKGFIELVDDRGRAYEFKIESVADLEEAHRWVKKGPSLEALVSQYVADQLVFTGRQNDSVNGDMLVADFNGWKLAQGCGEMRGGRNILYSTINANEKVSLHVVRGRTAFQGFYAKNMKKTQKACLLEIVNALESDELI